MIANFGVGVNHIDVPAATRAGMTVTNTPDVLTEDTADLAMGLMLALMRRMGEGEREVRAGTWTGWHPTQFLGAGSRGRPSASSGSAGSVVPSPIAPNGASA
jgi:lactate dehydrogenase-like 2-hydroxyacid dehydrogenase